MRSSLIFLKGVIESEALPIKTIGRLSGVNGDTLSKLYKNKLSGFFVWESMKKSKRRAKEVVCFTLLCRTTVADI